MFDDFDFDFNPLSCIQRKLVREAIKEGKEIADMYATEANHNKLKRALEDKCRNASSDAERRVYQKMLDQL